MGICELKAKKGLIRVSSQQDKGKIKSISITGDFMVFPEDVIWEMEKGLIGIDVDEKNIREMVKKYLSNAKLMGSSIDDFVEVIICSLRGE
ncbi:Bacterial lipoate protein ligase C-terminus [Caldisphaera lagunensis DSM 15908]|uniref:lipoate--protein ligase n=1 Tax=Caldisphaera lagunensis (strain DSM 15908 / JCM 11604 / ANMR 0165 / IC-154) TaxID=1056495 RepID=L0ACF9_CALLD|nr:lipoate protein ligase C-terminal domain-containing protein [Caldisphaera lagunensis]AFZ70735.1 Bacterial lipoate protein ligase C-terminus [Caldisphaera lagunensis DSM 15908]